MRAVYRGVDAAGEIGYSGGRSLPAYPGDPNAGDLTLWDLRTGERIASVTDGFNWSLLASGDLTAATDDLLFIAFHEDRALLGVRASDGAQRAALINASDGSLIRSFEDELAASLASADFLDATTLLSATYDHRIILWSGVDGALIREIAAAPMAIEDVAMSPDGNTVVGRAADGEATLWRLNERWAEPVATYPGALPGTALSPSGETLLLVNAGGATLREIGSDEFGSQFEARLVSSAGAVFALYAGDHVSVHDIDTGAELRRWPVDWNDAQRMRLSSDGRLLLAEADGALWLLRAETEAPMLLNAGGAGPPLEVAFAAGGANFATLHGERALLWDAASGGALGAYPLGAASPASVDLAFSPDGETLYFFVRLEGGLAGLTAVAIADNAVRRHTFLDVALRRAVARGRIPVAGAARGRLPNCRHSHRRDSARAAGGARRG